MLGLIREGQMTNILTGCKAKIFFIAKHLTVFITVKYDC